MHFIECVFFMDDMNSKRTTKNLSRSLVLSGEIQRRGGRGLVAGAGFDDFEEVGGVEGGAADEAAVDVGVGEEGVGVAGVAAATVEDGDVVGEGLAVVTGDGGTDVGVHFLGLVGGGGAAGADGPDGLVGDDDVTELVGGEVEEGPGELFADDGEVLFGLALGEGFADAVDDVEVVLEGTVDFEGEGFVGFVVVGPALGVADDDEAGAGGGDHGGGYFAGVGTGGLGGAVLRGDEDGGLGEVAGDFGEVDVGGGEDDADALGAFLVTDVVVDFTGEGDSLVEVFVHFPVACYDFCSHDVIVLSLRVSVWVGGWVG